MEKLDNLKNIHIIPAGYINTAFHSSFSRSLHVKVASARKYRYAFWGGSKKGIKAGVRQMRDQFQGEPSSVHLSTTKVPHRSAREMIAAYNDSVFVLVRKGNHHWDCFRNSEASKVGAIPVGIMPIQAIQNCFSDYVGWEGRPPPWIIAKGWYEASKLMKALLKDPAKLDLMQSAVLQWYDLVIDAARGKILEALQKGPFQKKSTDAELDDLSKNRKTTSP